MSINEIETRVFRVPLKKPWGDQTHQITHIEIIVTEIGTTEGTRGLGFSYTVGFGGMAIKSLLDHYLRQALYGQACDPRIQWPRLWRAAHDVGGGGVVTASLAALDIAMWDVVAKSLGKPLVDVLGRHRTSITAYGSGINLHLSQKELLEQVRGWQDQGYDGVKIKVGKPDLEEDLDRVNAVRQLIGPYGKLMLDANQGWNITDAVKRCQALEQVDPYWIEEPLIADDVLGHAELAKRTRIPVAIGENVYTVYQYNQYLSLGACAFSQADVVRSGGITPYLRIAALCDAWNVPMAPHFMMEITGQVLCSIPNAHILEDVEGGSFSELGIQRSLNAVDNGVFSPPTVPGHGILFDMATLDPLELR